MNANANLSALKYTIGGVFKNKNIERDHSFTIDSAIRITVEPVYVCQLIFNFLSIPGFIFANKLNLELGLDIAESSGPG